MKNLFARFWDAIVLLRIPFSLFLLPVFLLGLSLMPISLLKDNILVYMYAFLIIHLGLYPASNGYNSWFDRDETPIGGLATPPKVNGLLIWLVYVLDIATLLAAYFLGFSFFLWMVVYTLVSKAYSNPWVRLKKWPIISTLTVIFFQGPGISLALFSLVPFELNVYHYCGLMGSALFLVGSYPLTQIYQHEEDAARGDTTLSLKLGINGTFQLANVAFGLGGALLLLSLFMLKGWLAVFIFGIGVLPVLGYFFWWWRKVLIDKAYANHRYLSYMNMVSSLGLTLVYVFIIWLSW